MTKEKAALPGGKTAYLARLCMVQPPSLQMNDVGRSDLAMASLGP